MEFRLAKKNELRRCAKIAGESFEDYVFYKMFPMEEQKRLRFIHKIMSTGVRCAFSEGELLVGLEDCQIVAVAIVERPNRKPTSGLTYIQHGGLNVLLAGGKTNTLKWMKMLEECDSAIHGLTEPYWYLSSLTIANGYKGQGIGSRMIRGGIIPWVKENGGGFLTLITNSEENKCFYERNGFELFDTTEIKRNGMAMTNWSFRMQV